MVQERLPGGGGVERSEISHHHPGLIVSSFGVQPGVDVLFFV